MDRLLQKNSVEEKIRENRVLLVSGPDAMLSTLPPGNWIGGVSGYFVHDSGILYSQSTAWALDLTEIALSFEIAFYDENNIDHMAIDTPDTGFSIVVVPFESKIHELFARKNKNGVIAGWVCGTDKLDHLTAKAYAMGQHSTSKAAVLHIATKDEFEVTVSHPYEPIGNHFSFPSDGFNQSKVMQHGKTYSASDFFRKNRKDRTTPIMDETGKTVGIASAGKFEVRFFAPVFSNRAYFFTKKNPDEDRRLAEQTNTVLCIKSLINTIYGQDKTMGPFSLGQIGNGLWNQADVFLKKKSLRKQ